ncbi:hypothetical protein [Providencia stuartii]|uniref:hypothetical protein n=1 Tax=Providencia stuartii TaxID=588 RepID=UPI0021165DDE|nr:hypothetical protein [Providencia stuartii]MDK7738135.1 hypothetical protein [Providencia stuartii]
MSPKGQVKMFAEAGFDAAAKIGIEATPFLRDNEFIAYNFVTGVETRINDLKERFSRACNEAQKGEIPINLISVSVFGFDMGATLARYFIGVLVNQLCQKNYDTGLYFYGAFTVVLGLTFLLWDYSIALVTRLKVRITD